MSKITINGIQYEFEDISPDLKKLLDIHSLWTEELGVKRLELAKVEAALRDISREIISLLPTK